METFTQEQNSEQGTRSNGELAHQLQERFMAKSSLLEETDTRFMDVEDHERALGQGYYRLGKVYYDKADLENAEDYFLRALGQNGLSQRRVCNVQMLWLSHQSLL